MPTSLDAEITLLGTKARDLSELHAKAGLTVHSASKLQRMWKEMIHYLRGGLVW